MKKTILIILAAMILAATTSVNAQKKLAITDKTQFLTGEIETILSDRLANDSIELTSMIDTRRRCDYWFATLITEGSELKLSVVDCNDKPAGSKDLGSRIMTAADSEKALLLYFALSEILKGPYKDAGETAPALVPATTAASSSSKDELPITDPGQHRTRYFFAPSSYNLEKGELYYNSLYFLVHDVQYGISEKFSMGMGTTIFGIPFYLTPKFTIPVNDKSAFAVGDILILGTYGAKFTGNLLYGTYTKGGSFNNFTVGGGYLRLGGGDVTNVTNAPVFNFSSLLQLSGHIYFITENYGSQIRTKQTANYYNYVAEEYASDYFNQNVFFIYGLTGFRFINRTKDLKSWQVGLSYIFTSSAEVPAMYKTTFWNYSGNIGTKFIAFPVIGYARKFSTRY